MDGKAQAQGAISFEGRGPPDLMVLTADIVSAYVTNNPVQPRDLAALIASMHQALGGLGKSAQPVVEPAETLSPAQIRKSITPDGLISFIDGKSYMSMKRHLTKHGLDPQTYRERFGLPSDYPMVSANYSAKRSAMAKSLGLGQIRKKVAQDKTTLAEASKRRGRPRTADTAEAVE